MTKKCDCFRKNLDLIKEKLKDRIPEGAVDVEFSWDGASLFMGGDYSPVNPSVNFQYRAPKKSGGYRANLTKNSCGMMANYCCFCGRKLNKSNKG